MPLNIEKISRTRLRTFLGKFGDPDCKATSNLVLLYNIFVFDASCFHFSSSIEHRGVVMDANHLQGPVSGAKSFTGDQERGMCSNTSVPNFDTMKS